MEEGEILSLYSKLSLWREEAKGNLKNPVSSVELTEKQRILIQDLLIGKLLESRKEEKQKAVKKEKSREGEKSRRQEIKDRAIKYIVPVFVLGRWLIEVLQDHLRWV